MKRIIIIGICLLLTGALMMPVNANNVVFEGKPGMVVYVDDIKIATVNETGIIVLDITKDVILRFEKEGWKTEIINWSAKRHLDNPKCVLHVPVLINKMATQTPTPEPTLEPTLEPRPTPPPTPLGHRSQEQRITDLEQQTQDQETKLSWLMNKVEAIIAFLKGLGFKE